MDMTLSDHEMMLLAITVMILGAGAAFVILSTAKSTDLNQKERISRIVLTALVEGSALTLTVLALLFFDL